MDKPLLAGMDSGVFQKLQDLLLASSSILWVTKGAYRFAENPEQNLAQGLLRTLRSEAGKTAATLDLDPQSKLDSSSIAELILRTLKRTLEADPAMMVDFEYAEEDGSLVTPRIVESSDMNQIMHRETRSSAQYLQDFGQEDRRLKVVVGTTGALDSLYFKDDPETPLEADEVEVRVAATGMNFKDVVIAMGQVASSYLGVECAGTVARIGSNVDSVTVGDRVCAMVLGAYSTFARCKATSVAIIPDDMTYETAASVPVVYSTAYYGIFELARLEPGEKILIHAASGGVGQAAIQLAKRVGADIFATVGTAEKKKLLMDKYDIPENRIFYSRSAAFGPAIREATGGQGVDVVLNSLAGDLLRETWDCVAHFGRFIEIGKRDITSNTRLEMAQFEYNASFSSVDLTLLALERPKIMGRVLQSCMELLMNGEIKPIDPITVMGIADIESALRMLQSGKTSGKVVLSHRPKDQVMVSSHPHPAQVGSILTQLKATHPSNKTPAFRSDASYIVIGGTGGLGRSMARWMVQQGARHIVLLSRGGVVTDELEYLINDSADEGSSIYVKACDVADEASVAKVVNECQSEMPPIRGVIHAAMVLRVCCTLPIFLSGLTNQFAGHALREDDL
jgi:NADPH:quinone reductase-like Zn-dependent oxidoreductase